MSARNRKDIVSRVAEYLRVEGIEEGKFVVRLECKEMVIVIPCDEWPEEPAASKEKEVGRWLSPLERRIVDYLAGRGGEWSRGEDVAAALNEPYQHRFKSVLTNLCDRMIVEPLSGSGYRLAS